MTSNQTKITDLQKQLGLAKTNGQQQLAQIQDRLNKAKMESTTANQKYDDAQKELKLLSKVTGKPDKIEASYKEAKKAVIEALDADTACKKETGYDSNNTINGNGDARDPAAAPEWTDPLCNHPPCSVK